jgi:hypothetical protein
MPPIVSPENIVTARRTTREILMAAMDIDYWLGHCQGFRVDSPEGRIGQVEDVLFRTQLQRPDTLLVRSGLLGTRLVAVPADEVEEIAPRKEQISLRRRPDALRCRTTRSHLLPRLMDTARHGDSLHST